MIRWFFRKGKKSGFPNKKLAPNIIFYLVFQNAIYDTVLFDVCKIGLRNGKSFKNYLVRTTLPKTDETGRYRVGRMPFNVFLYNFYYKFYNGTQLVNFRLQFIRGEESSKK